MEKNFNCPPTNPELLALIERARHYKMTPEDYREQRVSFVYGQMGHKSGWTKDQVRAFLAERGMA